MTIAGQPNEKRVKEQGITAISYIGSPSTDQLGAIAKLVSEGKVDVKITETFPMTLEGVRMRMGWAKRGTQGGKSSLRQNELCVIA
ncbi:hypothetical protein BK127_38815 [Paenibacillus sp. FSL H7-0331]|nr:hypothetical protein BK127_38815 [Paenibacillus sp. FSL H7-0331]